MRIFRAIWRRLVLFLVNNILAGTRPLFFPLKARLLRSIGYKIGNNTKIVGPIICSGTLSIGDNCWIGTNFTVRGSGTVTLGNNLDVAPDVTFLTGSHDIGTSERRAGRGRHCNIVIGSGCWIGGRSTFLNDLNIGDSNIIAAGAVVCKDLSQGGGENKFSNRWRTCQDHKTIGLDLC